MDAVYGELILENYENPNNYGSVKNADIKAVAGNLTCGDQTTLTLKIERGKVKDIKFIGGGCSISVASQSILTEFVKGKTVENILKLSDENFLKELGGIIPARQKCALLGKIALQKGLKDWKENKGKKIKIEIKI